MHQARSGKIISVGKNMMTKNMMTKNRISRRKRFLGIVKKNAGTEKAAATEQQVPRERFLFHSLRKVLFPESAVSCSRARSCGIEETYRFRRMNIRRIAQRRTVFCFNLAQLIRNAVFIGMVVLWAVTGVVIWRLRWR